MRFAVAARLGFAMWRYWQKRGHLREAYETNRVLLLDPGASPFTWFLDRFLDFSLLGGQLQLLLDVSRL